MPGVVAQHLERLALVDLVALHEDALGALGLGAAPEGALQVVVLRETAERDVERALQLLGRAVDDVGEDAALGGLVDERGVMALEHRDHRAVGLADDPLDQLQRVRRARAEADECDVGVLVRGQRADLGDVRRSGDHDVAQARDELGDQRDPVLSLVRDQHAQRMRPSSGAPVPRIDPVMAGVARPGLDSERRRPRHR